MTKRALYILIILLVILGAGAFFALRPGEPVDSSNQNATSTPGENGGEEITEEPVLNSMVRVASPAVGATVVSPLSISGEARGGWYFEASFPVKILDANGAVLGEHYAQAQGDWMTENFVPFTSTLSFRTPTTQTGTLVLQKDNPSGLPENDAEVRIPVRFGNVASSQTRLATLYFYNEDKDKDSSGNILCSAAGLQAVERRIPVSITPIQDTIRALIAGGVTSAEASQGLETEFPLDRVTLTAASLSGGVLTLTFNDPLNETSGGSCRVSILRAQIEATAKQFGGVNSVRIMPESVFQP